jgi:hypothetical protein
MKLNSGAEFHLSTRDKVYCQNQEIENWYLIFRQQPLHKFHMEKEIID